VRHKKGKMGIRTFTIKTKKRNFRGPVFYL
jgi:hypothetical protein